MAMDWLLIITPSLDNLVLRDMRAILSRNILNWKGPTRIIETKRFLLMLSVGVITNIYYLTKSDKLERRGSSISRREASFGGGFQS